MWEVIQVPKAGEIHVIPINDTKEHITYHCVCDPAHEEQPNGVIMKVHHSWDGREWVEQAREIIDTK